MTSSLPNQLHFTIYQMLLVLVSHLARAIWLFVPFNPGSRPGLFPPASLRSFNSRILCYVA